jgi:hypothetical protein
VPIAPDFHGVHRGSITNLRKFTAYFTSVLCFTTPGDGPPSAPQLVRTLEDSEYAPCHSPMRCSLARARVGRVPGGGPWAQEEAWARGSDSGDRDGGTGLPRAPDLICHQIPNSGPRPLPALPPPAPSRGGAPASQPRDFDSVALWSLLVGSCSTLRPADVTGSLDC